MTHQLRQKRRRQRSKRRFGSTGFVLKQVFCIQNSFSMFQPLVLLDGNVHEKISPCYASGSVVVLLGQINKNQPFLYLRRALKAVRRPGVW